MNDFNMNKGAPMSRVLELNSDPNDSDVLLEVDDLHISFDTPTGPLYAVNGVSLKLRRGEMFSILGESGCGKSATAKSIMGILPMPPGRIRRGSIRFAGQELTELSHRERRAMMGADIAWVPQDPLSSLNPSFKIGWQVIEAIRTHKDVSRSAARERAAELLDAVGLQNPREQLDKYPFELSGGMRQRVLIAMAIATEPQLLIADEPTTALDVTIQAEILQVLKEIQIKNNMAVLMITHDCALAAAVADRVAVMYAGRVIESGPTAEIFHQPAHPYTRGLMQSTPSLAMDEKLEPVPGTPPKLMDPPSGCSFAPRCSYCIERCKEAVPPQAAVSPSHQAACIRTEAVIAEPSLIDRFLSAESLPASENEKVTGPPLMMGRGLVKTFDGFRAVDGIDFDLHEGETLCIVGESGSGKSTLARLILGLESPTEGTVEYRGKPIITPGTTMQRELRREIQFVAQDPYSSLDPRMKVGKIISEGWRIHRGLVPESEWDEEAERLLARVGIQGEQILDRYPHEFSGGQRQRIAIARALAVRPSIVVLDEPISSLDVSVQAQVIRLLQDLQDEHGLAYIFIAHDLSVVEYLAKNIIVMYQGKVMERGPGKRVFNEPEDPYTARLASANPKWEASGRAVIQAAV
ncbi:dipeptide ABC transporter ATP-binding protein [Halomonas ramblicola]|uniref:dipeptide ABC transporter ATP-binding protein n=1 Tax=Halomonas ramblicola TaxID=747349 RepID=UPI0025B2EB2D|nr:ABC transporter ATP-binding protein [Halomonas ramblicola]MDN3520452.1 ABC transporter ATP-binding protein [Halomonas ramblicola]